MPRVSVIMPAYNEQRFIRDAVDSVLAQTLDDIEVIVVDDGSTDATPEILASYGDRITHLHQPNTGQPYAMNRALAAASGEYIALMDSDDIAVPERLAVQSAYLDAHPEISLVYTDMMRIDEQGDELWEAQSLPTDRFKLLYRNAIAGATVMIRRSCFDELGPFNVASITQRTDGRPCFNEDWEMWVRVTERFRIAHIARPLYRYRLHPQQGYHTHAADHWCLSKLRLREGASERAGRPFWLRLMVARVRVQCAVVRISGRRLWTFWQRVDHVLDRIEEPLIRRVFGDAVYRRRSGPRA